MKKNEDVYVKKGSYVKRHWKQWWALITCIPFAVALFLSWIYGAAGGYEWTSQVKLFFLFLQIGFITVYFLREGIVKAVVNLWATLIFLWILSLIVPYLSTQTNTVLDMSEAVGELSTPLYLFVSCLTAAWLLPGRWRMVARVLCSLLMVLYVLIQFTYIGYYFLTQSLLSVSMMIATAQTNVSEAVEYIEVNLPYAGLIGGVIVIVCLGWWIFRANRFSFAPPMRVSKRVRIFVLILFMFNCGLAALSIGATRIARVSAETYTTLKSFGEYQKILEKRRNMRITDPELRERLKAVPDGVYILVIGESLTREHMHVYGYERETTPFQTSAYFDPHYKFFGHVYSCYTQTVQVLTQALTEKNQYNGMVLADAYSLIDMAREAGFHTTWISNQSRFGIWDTPIGAIGSECDDQYWINQYVGTDVVTKDYDTALIPYLRKVNPKNRRQLIILHLMGSHVSYWDRYPGAFYHWPISRERQRSKAEVMIDEYDNSVLFNDYLMAGVMDVARNHLDADCVLYFSDHGEKVSERPGHNADQFDFSMVHIPFWLYLSDAYQSRRPLYVERMENRRNVPFTNDMLYDTFLGLMDMTAVHYDASADLMNDAYNKDLSMLMTMNGNVWLYKDTEYLGDGKTERDRKKEEEFRRRSEEKGYAFYDTRPYQFFSIESFGVPEVRNEGLHPSIGL